MDQWQYGQLKQTGAINNSAITFTDYASGNSSLTPGDETGDAWQKVVTELGEEGWILTTVLRDNSWVFRRQLTADVPSLPPITFGQ